MLARRLARSVAWIRLDALSSRVLFGTPLAQLKHYDLRPEVRVLHNSLQSIATRSSAAAERKSRRAIKHGQDLLRQRFTMSQVVHEYGDVCQAITELAVELNAPISTDDFRTLNRCLDDAIAGAATEYGRERNQSGIDGESARGSGAGLGLAFSRWGAEANDGPIYARDLPGAGCVFTVDLPRRPDPALEVLQA